jgi:hypothetical protein
MASLSPNKQYAVPTVNADNNVWGAELNATLAQIDLNLGGSQTVSLASGNVTASATQAATLITVLDGVLTGATEYILPAGYGAFLIVSNQTTGAYTATVASAGGGTNVVVPAGATMGLYTDGTNVVSAVSALVGPVTISTGPVTITTGGVVLTDGNITLTNGALVVNSGGIISTTSTAEGVTSIVTGSAALGAFNANIADFNTQSLANWFVASSGVGSISATATTTSYNTTSDARLKEPVELISEALAGRIIDHLKARMFRWRRPAATPEPGFFAQELHKVFPWAVRVGQGRPGTKRFRPWETDVAKLMPVVVAELQFLRRRVAELEAQASGRSETQGRSDRKRYREGVR